MQFFEIIRYSVGAPWYIGEPEKLQRINSTLLKIKPPSRIARKPRDISTYKNWKISEWRNWVEYYSLPYLDGVLEPDYLKIWAKFCQATYIFNSSSISRDNYNLACNLMREFTEEFREFGLENMSFNVHFGRHQKDSVLYYGPLWGYSTFPFEAMNQKFIANVTSPYCRAEQIAIRFLLKKFVILSAETAPITPTAKNEIRSLLSTATRNIPEEMPEGRYITGEGLKITRRPTNREILLLDAAGFPIPEQTSVNIYKKAVIHGV